MKRVLMVATLLAAIGVAGCTQQGQVLLPGPGALPAGHLYVSDGNANIFVFTLPVSGASTPVVTTSATSPRGISLSASHLFVAQSSTTVSAFALPLTNASTPAFSITLTHSAQDVTIGPSGNLYASEPFSTSCCIEAVLAPLSGASTPAFSMTLASAGGFPWGATFDPSGNLFVAGSAQVAEFTPPFSGSSTPAFHFGVVSNNYGIASDATGRIFVSNGPSNGQIDVYTPPYSNASTPTFTITVSVNALRYLAFDLSGNLYAAVPGDNKVFVFTPPFSGTSTAAVSVSVVNARGLAIGP